jgi:hypothetical protein
MGAFVLALDILLRRRAGHELRNLQDLSEHTRRAGSKAIYKGLDVASPEFAEQVMNRSATKLALAGTALLTLGFAMLVSYHLLEIKETNGTHTTHSEFRKSDFQ